MSGRNRRVLVVEDEQLFAHLLEKTLREIGFVVRTANSVIEARSAISEFDPDLVLLDIALGHGPSGLHLAHSISTTRPEIGILFLTQFSDAKSASSSGLSIPPNAGFIRKHLVTESDDLVKAIDAVLSDKAHEVRQDATEVSPFAGLPEMAYQVLRLLSDGYSNGEIAVRCNLSMKSVERWIDHIYKALGIETKGKINPRVTVARLYYQHQGIPKP